MDIFFFLMLVVAIVFGAVSLYRTRSHRIAESKYNVDLRSELDQSKRQLFDSYASAERKLQLERNALDSETAKRRSDIEKQEIRIRELERQFSQSYIQGRKWLAKMVSESQRLADEALVDRMRTKTRPALKGAEEVRLAKAERRRAIEHAWILEYQIEAWKEYFPVLADYEEELLNEKAPVIAPLDEAEIEEDEDPVLRFIPKA